MFIWLTISLLNAPYDEVRVRLLHDELLGADVLLLPGVHDVPLLQDLHGKCFVLLAFELHLLPGARGEKI